ncbi:MAG: hypothetical protein H6686_10065 [Fibrobacteria bacterium]|nr:hypothetical protein [Fibrobacteria bacterium]
MPQDHSEHVLDRALRLAVDSHAGQLDRAGQPYILHVLQVVMGSRPDPEAMAVAALHDVVEDSSVTLADLKSQGFPKGATCTLDAEISDTSLAKVVVSAASIRIVGKPDRNGSARVVVRLQTGARAASQTVDLVVAPVNDPPTLSVVGTLSAVPDGGTIHFDAWKTSQAPGPSDEQSQKIRFEVQADSSSNLLAEAPRVDSTGRLVILPKGISGTVRLSIRAIDDGDSVLPARNRSQPQALRLRLDSRPTLKAAKTVTGYEDQRITIGDVLLEDLETPLGSLEFDWSVLDSTLLSPRDVRIKSITGGFNLDAQGKPNRYGRTGIAFRLSDAIGNKVFDTTWIDILPVNDSPTIAKNPDLPDTIKIPCTSSDTTLPRLFSDISWEPGISSQTGKWSFTWVDAAQAKFFENGIQTLTSGGIRLRINLDTTMIVRLMLTVTDDGGTENGGNNTGRRILYLKYTNTIVDIDGFIYSYRRMPDGKHWMEQNLRTKPRNGDTSSACGRGLDDGVPNCARFGRLYTWQQALNAPTTCSSTDCIGGAGPAPSSPLVGLCPEGWHVPSSADWSTLLRTTMPSGSLDSAYNLRSTDTLWRFPSPTGQMQKYPGSGKFGNFLEPVDLISPYGSKYGFNGVSFWLPVSPVALGTDFDFPLSIMFTSVVNQGINSEAPAALRCIQN